MRQSLAQTLQDSLRDPPRLICALLILGLGAYLVADLALIYAKLDFQAADLGQSPVSDFFVFYSSSRFLSEARNLGALYDPAALKAYQVSLGAGQDGLHPFNYPPPYALLIAPLSLLPYAAALISWQWVTLAAFVFSLRKAGLTGIEILAAVVAPASAINMAAGQNGVLTSALLIGGMAMLARRPVAAGSLFGLLTLKPHLGVLVPFACLAERRWRVIAAAVLAGAVLIALSILATGLEAWTAYIDFLRWFRAEAQAQQDGPFLALTTTPYMAAQIAGLPKLAGYTLQTAVTIYVCAAVYDAYRQDSEPDLRLALLLVGVSLASLYGNLYDLPCVAVAIVLLSRRGLRDGFLPFENVCLLFAFILPFVGGPLNEARVPIVPAVHLILFFYIRARLHSAEAMPRTQPAP